MSVTAGKSADLSLPADERSPGLARRHVAAALHTAGRDDVLDTALLLTTELTTNAVVHAGTTVEVSVRADPEAVLVTVTDSSPSVLGPPADPALLEEGGRGLFLVEALADRWGTTHTRRTKSVWFDLGLCRGAGLIDAAPSASPAPGDQVDQHDHVVDPAVARGDHSGRRGLAWFTGLETILERHLDTEVLAGELLARLAEGLAAQRAVIWTAPEDGGPAALVAQVGVRPGTPVLPDTRLAVDGPPGYVPDLARSPQVGTVLGGQDDGALLAVPLRAGVSLGLLELWADRAGAFGPDDEVLARLCADRVAVAIQAERLREGEQRNRQSLGFLAAASELLAGTLDVRLLLALVPRLAVPLLGEWATVHLLDDRGRPTLAGLVHVDEDRVAEVEALVSGPAGEQLRQHLLWATGADEVLAVPGAVFGSERGTALVIPLTARRRSLGALLVARPQGPAYSPEEQAVGADLGRRVALAVDNARLYGERTSVAQALQAALLPPELPGDNRLEFGARYVAAGEGNKVGGDFYDVAADGDGWCVAIGDVCGKGAAAAAATGLVRTVIRALASDGRPLPEVLRRLNDMMLDQGEQGDMMLDQGEQGDMMLDQGEQGRFATVAVARVAASVAEGRAVSVTLVTAGHPPAVLLPAYGNPRFVGGLGTLVGVTTQLRLEEVALTLDPGDALVFYTDGVTERRRGTEMFGEAHLLTVLAACRGLTADEIAGRVESAVRTFAPEAPRDDLAVLVVRAVPQPVANG